MTPSELVERYVAAVRAKDIDGFLALFAEDAVFILPNGRAFEGKAAIREIQLSVFAISAPMPTPVSVIVGEGRLAIEIEARLPDGSIRRTANLYTLDEAGRITRLSVYVKI